MQQTQKYKLNLIETSDTFSPAPLNENMEKVEAQLCAVRTEASAESNALDQRVTVLEAHKLATGTYIGDGTSARTVTLGFKPRLVFVQPGGNIPIVGVVGGPAAITMQEDGFRVSGSDYNRNGIISSYFAIL